MKDPYLEDFLRPIRQCLAYKPAFGTSTAVSELEFIDRYGSDFFYDAVGLVRYLLS